MSKGKGTPSTPGCGSGVGKAVEGGRASDADVKQPATPKK
uniref:Uncharacterized protein n=1 Tax=viral metagenome TaxID=1070528 RepID=A0A6H1ZJY5_9ZZZZ